MWVKFGGKLVQTGEYTEFELEHEILWDDVMLKVWYDFGAWKTIMEVTYVNPRIRLIKTMLNPVLDKIDTKYDNKLHKDISRSSSGGSYSKLFSSGSWHSNSYEENTVVELKGKTDKYTYRKNYEEVELKFPLATTPNVRGDILVLQLTVKTDTFETTLSRALEMGTTGEVLWWIEDHANKHNCGFYDQDSNRTSRGMRVLPKIFPELNIEKVLQEFIEKEKEKALTELAQRLNSGLEGV